MPTKESATLLECLTRQIVESKVSVEDARQIVLRHQYHKRIHAARDTASPNRFNMRASEITLIENALREANGNISASARLLGLPAATLYRKIHRYRITVERQY